MAKQQPPPTSPYADIPLPSYVAKWDAAAYRPKTLPPAYEPRLDPAHIFALEGQDDGSELYVVSHRCTHCAQVRQVCSRGEPACRRCTQKGLQCTPTDSGWIEVPLPRKKPALRNEVQALKKSLPDAPYYREHSKSVAKSMSTPSGSSRASALRKGMRQSMGQDSVSPAHKARGGNVGRGRRAVSKRSPRKAPVSPEHSNDEGDDTSQEAAPTKPVESTNMPSPTPQPVFSPTQHSAVPTRPLLATDVEPNRVANALQSPPDTPDIAPVQATVQQPVSGLANTPTQSQGSADLTATSSVSSPVRTPSSSVLTQSEPPAPIPTVTPSITPPDVPVPSASRAVAMTSPYAPMVPRSANAKPAPAPTVSSRLSIRLPPRGSTLTSEATSAQKVAEQFLGISASGLMSTSAPAPSSVVSPPLRGPGVPSPPQASTSTVVTSSANTTLNGATNRLNGKGKEKEKTAAERQDDASCSFRLSAPAWSTPAPTPAPGEDGNVSDADSETSNDEPLKVVRKRVNGASDAPNSTSSSASGSVRTSVTPNTAAGKRKRAPEPNEEMLRRPVPWWTQGPMQWYTAPIHHPSSSGTPPGMMPIAFPIAFPPPVPTVRSPSHPQHPVEPFLTPLRPPLPSIQQRAQRLAQVQQQSYIPPSPSPQPQPQSPAPTQPQVQRQTPDTEYDSEEEVAQYLKRPRRPKSSSSRSSTSRTSPQESLSFVPRQRILQDSTAVMVEDVLFHLPRSRLVQNSEFFARQLAKEHEREKDREVEGVNGDADANMGTMDRCPVVKVNGVCAEDFEALLGVCDDLGSFLEKQPHFKTLAAVFCVSRTLRFGQIDALATYKFTSMWPSDLHKLSPVRTPYAAETVILARMYNTPGVLKRAFYELLRSEGFAQCNLNVASSSSAETSSREVTLDGSRLIGKAKLSHTDLVRLITAREKLSLAWTLLVGSAPSSSSLPCMLQHTTTPNTLYSTNAARERCAVATQNSAAIWAEWVLDSGLFESWMYDPICGLERLSVLDWESSGYCSSCVMARRQLWSRKREEIWENLDVWLGL